MKPHILHRFATITKVTTLGIVSLIYAKGVMAQVSEAQTVSSTPTHKAVELPASTASSAVSGSSGSSVDALMLKELLNAAATTYPMLVAARTEVKASAQDIKAAERARWPSLSATVESDTGSLRSYPNRAVQVDQTIWDAGRNSARINESKTLADISLLKVYLQQQEVFLQITNAWQNMIASRERLAVAERTLQRLRSYQAQMRRRVQAEASPSIDLELVDSRLLQTEVEVSAAKMSLQVALTRLEQYSGLDNLLVRSSSAMYAANVSDTEAFNQKLTQIDWAQIAAEHPLVAKTRLEVTQAKQRLASKQAEAYPQVFARVYKPLNTLPNNSDTSATAFLGLRYTPGAGFANIVEAQAISTRILSTEQSVEAAYRETLQSLQNEREEFVNSRTRLASLEQAVKGSDKVLESYQRQFQAGRKSWLDLLNAVREMAQNQYALADAKAAMAAAMNRLQIRMGQDPQ